jgi:hypothetical protein
MANTTRRVQGQPTLEIVPNEPPPVQSSTPDDELTNLYTTTAATNLDGRTSVLEELPQGLYAEARKFAIAEKSLPRSVMFDKPRGSDWAMIHPDLERYRTLYCIKDGKTRKLYPILQAVMQQSEKLKAASRLYLVRQAKIYKGDFFLWPVPWFDDDRDDTQGDSTQRDAHIAAQKDWVKLVWVGSDYEVRPTEEPGAFTAPDWTNIEGIDPMMRRAIVPNLLLQDLDHSFVKEYLGRRK